MELSLFLFILLVLVGLSIGTLSSMVGLGGGIFYIPLLVIYFAVSPEKAVGTSLFCMVLTTLSSTIGYARTHLVNWKLGLSYDIFDIPGIIIGAYLTALLPDTILKIICGLAITIVALLVIFKKQTKQLSDKKTSKLKWIAISSMAGGLVTGLVGLGGGTVDTSTMLLLGTPMQVAAGSSSFAMLLTNIVGFGSHYFLGNIIWTYAIPLGLASFIGAQIGSSFANKINGKKLRIVLGIIALISGFRLFLN